MRVHGWHGRYPPHVLPPGVHEGGDVDASSLIDWFIRYYVQIDDQRKSRAPKDRPRECVVGPGELLCVRRAAACCPPAH